MTLTIDYTTRTFTVQHSDGKSEGFKTLAAVYAKYKELEPVVTKRPRMTKLEYRELKQQAGVK